MNLERSDIMFKRILKTVLNVLLFLSLIILSYLTIIRGVLFEQVDAKSEPIDMTKIQSLANYTKEDFHKIFDGILKENEIPVQIIDEILEDQNQKQMIDDYIDEVIDAIQSQKKVPEIPIDKVENVVETGIQKYNQKYNTNINASKMKTLVNDVVKKGEVVLNFVNQNLKILNGVRFIFNDTVYYSFLFLTLILIIVIAILFKKEAIFSLGGISIFNGLALLITFCILRINALQNILEFLPINLSTLKKTFLTNSIVFIVTGILLFVLYRILLVHEEKKKGRIKAKIN